MIKKLLPILILCCFMFAAFKIRQRTTEAQTTPASISGKFYKFDTVADTQANDFAQVNNSVSINGNGTIALIARKNNSGGSLNVDQIFKS